MPVNEVAVLCNAKTVALLSASAIALAAQKSNGLVVEIRENLLATAASSQTGKRQQRKRGSGRLRDGDNSSTRRQV